jgi:hypothetical protein
MFDGSTMTFKLALWTAAVVMICGTMLSAQTPLAVVEDSLPTLVNGVEIHTQLHARGGQPPYVWSIASGELPEGITLTPEGLLHGKPTKSGTFSLVLKIEDSGRPAHTINKEFKVVIATSLLLEWNQPPKVHDNRIDGSVQVSNGSSDTFDLTVVIVAVAENGRATAIGYEHFDLKPSPDSTKIPFGNTLPSGAYVIHADAIAEIAAKNAILRQRLQTPQPLHVTVGP